MDRIDCVSHKCFIFQYFNISFRTLFLFFSAEKPISPKAVKGFDVPQLTKNYYSVVSFLN